MLLLANFFILSSFVVTASGQQMTASRPVARLVAAYQPTKTARTHVDSRTQLAPAVVAMSSVAPTPLAASLERRAFDLINDERRANGQGLLVWDEELSGMARLHSEHMAQQNFFNHVGPDGLDTDARARVCGIRHWSALGENIAYNQGYDDPAAFAVERWIHSAKHRYNILNAGFTRSGIGVAKAADGRVFFTQVFITR